MSLRTLLGTFPRLSLRTPTLAAGPSTFATPIFAPPTSLQVRHKSLVPRRTKYRKAHKGRIPIALGGSTKGTVLECGDYGLRVNEPVRLTAKHLETAEATLKRALKPIKGCSVYLRVFPDIPVCIKGNETRMGKGKGTFEFWSCRAGVGKVIIEIGGPNLRPEIAHAAMRLASSKLPVTTEVIDRTTPPRVGTISVANVDLGPKTMTAGEAARLLATKEAVENVGGETEPVKVVL
ncbi:hypothetical protein MNV49_006157 [Pseudohyphozyma bogoriensis]|nr:hypothetical protein MNV49_006157 [Pseudohyphozyma bogoriensis]